MNHDNLDDEERLKYLDKLNEVAKAVLPSMSFKRGYEEIPLGLGLTVYYENTVTVKNDSDFPISNLLTEKNDTHAYYVEKATVTTACGVKYAPNSGGWTPDGSSVNLLSANALPVVSVSDWELATQIIGISVGLPGGVLAPAY